MYFFRPQVQVEDPVCLIRFLESVTNIWRLECQIVFKVGVKEFLDRILGPLFK